MVPGDYTLILQSFDNNGSVKSTLKEDLITITVHEPHVCIIPSDSDEALKQFLGRQKLELKLQAGIAG